MAEIARETLADQVAAWIADRILSGEFRPGQTIVEGGLAERLQVSRSPVREAIRALAREGLLTIHPRRGMAVATLDAWDGSDLYECRAMLEGFCTRLAVGAITDAGIAEMKTILGQMQTAYRAGETPEYQRLNGRFHLTLYEACPNATVRDLIRLLWRKMQRYRAILSQDPKRLAESVAAHERVMAAVEQRNAHAAEQAIRSLILNARAALVDWFAAQQRAADAPGGRTSGEATR